MTNVFVQNLCFYRARFSIQSLFETTPCPLKGQRENHTGVLASDSSHEKTVDRRSITKRPFASKAVYICAENLMVGWLQVKSWDITVGSQLMLKIFYSWKRICIYLGVFVDCLRIINARSLSHVSIIAGFRHCELRSARRSTFFSDSFCQPFLGFAGNKFFVLMTKTTRLDGDGLAELWEAWEKWCLANVSNGTCARHFVVRSHDTSFTSGSCTDTSAVQEPEICTYNSLRGIDTLQALNLLTEWSNACTNLSFMKLSLPPESVKARSWWFGTVTFVVDASKHCGYSEVILQRKGWVDCAQELTDLPFFDRHRAWKCPFKPHLRQWAFRAGRTFLLWYGNPQ